MYGPPPYNDNNRYQPQTNRPINPMVHQNVYYNQAQPHMVCVKPIPQTISNTNAQVPVRPSYYYQPIAPYAYPAYPQPVQFVYPHMPAGVQFMPHQLPHPQSGTPIPGSTNQMVPPHSTQHLPMSSNEGSNPGIMSYHQSHSDGVITQSQSSVTQPQPPRTKRTLQIIDPNTNQEVSLNNADSQSSHNAYSEPTAANTTTATDHSSSDSNQSSKSYPAKGSMLREVHKRALDDSKSFDNSYPSESTHNNVSEVIKSNPVEKSIILPNSDKPSDWKEKTKPINVEIDAIDPPADQPEPSDSSVNSKDIQINDSVTSEDVEYDFHREPHESDANASKRKLIYDRAFLLSLSKLSSSLQKPDLSNTCSEIILDKPHEGPVYFTKSFDILPSYVQHMKPYHQGKGHKHSPNNARKAHRGSMPPTPQRIIDPPDRRKVELKRIEDAYVPKVFDKDAKKVVNGETDSAQVSEDLKRSIRAILNRVTPQNLDECMVKLMSLDFGSLDGLTVLKNTIFVKALKEEAYSVTFAEICKRVLFLQATNPETGKLIGFRNLLLTSCQKKFEMPLQEQLEIVASDWDEKIEEQKNESTKKLMFDDKQEQIAKQKDMFYGNIRFIGELFLKDIIPVKIIFTCISTLTTSREPEAIESLCKLLETVGSKLDESASRKTLDKCFEEMKTLKEELDNRLKYKLMDIIEMRSRGWALRKVQEQKKIRPMTKEELENEDKKKAQEREQEMNEQRAASKKYGASDARRSTPASRAPPPPQRQPINVSKMAFSSQISADDLMNFRPGKPFGNLAKGCGSKQDKKKQFAQDSEWIPAKGRSSHGNVRQYSRDNSRSRDASPRNRGGPSSLPPPQPSGPSVVRSVSFPNNSQYSKQSSGNTSGVSPTPSPSQSISALPTLEEKASTLKELRNSLPEDSDEFDKVYTKCEHILHEFIATDNIDDEVLRRIQNHLPFFVTNLLNIMIEKDRITREKAGLIFAKLIMRDLLTPEQLILGFDLFLENAEDLLIDIPGLWKFMAECLQSFFIDENSNVGFLVEILANMKEPANILSDILHMASGRLGHQMVATIFEQSQLNWKMFLTEGQDLDQFIETKKLAFTINANSGSGDTIDKGRDIAELESTLIELQFSEKLRDFKVENEEIFGILETQVDKTTSQSSDYIQMILGLVFESTIDNKGQLNPQILEERLPIIKYIVRQKPEEKVQVIYAMQRLNWNLKLESSNSKHFLESALDALATSFILDSETILEWEEGEPQITDGYEQAKETLRTYLGMIRTSL